MNIEEVLQRDWEEACEMAACKATFISAFMDCRVVITRVAETFYKVIFKHADGKCVEYCYKSDFNAMVFTAVATQTNQFELLGGLAKTIAAKELTPPESEHRAE